MKILYVTTVSNTANAFLIPHVRWLKENGHSIDITFNIDQEIKNELKEVVENIFVSKFNRSPLNIKNFFAYRELRKIIDKGGYDLVHTHTPVASAFVRYSLRKNKMTKVIYTAHGFHFHENSSLLSWFLYYPIEKILSKYTDTIVTINQEDFRLATEKLKAGNVAYIPGVGINIEEIKKNETDTSQKRKELGVPDDAFLVLSIGELNRNKNHKVIIRAISRLNNPKIYYVICGKGGLEPSLKKLIKSLNITENVKILGHRNDVHEILQTSNAFAFPSFREGLPVAIMEAMAHGVPVVCSDIRGNSDLISHNTNGYLVPPKDIGGFMNSIDKIYKNEDGMNDLFSSESKQKIERFSNEVIKEEIINLYKNQK
ncbi:glycosyltransferase family 1 protein [Exiguobacterium sp. SH3S2]|uniref:glycosyltransferase family 4 protein n=1 Tax=Exiguobacterium sp. SH3S2 TaxID=2510956 RepID=UPI00103C4357|nr:glycosyltransferase family 4 protein [Exiguobacterium sp. SH3S2]TCI46220.1 glycosyltransferase family 1 protein [Exiguobacterium sp. SH3S3]TCI61308.1 glycosyltransferase family 1 protein [Exiguobacterium sp. SH3S2]